MNVPVTGKIYSDYDKQHILKMLESGEEITYGTWNRRLERRLAEYIGTKFSYYVNSGSSANLLAFAAFASPQMYPEWRISPGDEIITVAAAFPTTVAPIIQYGCIPVFVDIDETYNIDIESMYKALSPKTKGVVVAHTLGNPFNVTAVVQFCKDHNLFLIEDNADALGSTWEGQKTGSFGTISTSSFYPAHHMSTAQGGAVFTSYPRIAKILMSLRNWGKDCVCQPNEDGVCGNRYTQQFGDLPEGYDHKYVFSNFGYNLQGTNILAALGCAQLDRIETFTRFRHQNFDSLYSGLCSLPIGLPISYEKAKPSWFGFPIMLPDTHNRNQCASKLNAIGIGTRNLFAGNITKQPCFKDVPYRVVGDLNVTDAVMNKMLWVGCWHGLTEYQVEYTIEGIKSLFEKEVI